MISPNAIRNPGGREAKKPSRRAGFSTVFSRGAARLFLAATLVFAACPPLARARTAEPLSALAPRPDWNDLERFQGTITKKEFVRLLDSIYAPGGAWKEAIRIDGNSAVIRQPGSSRVDFRLKFARSAASAKAAPRYWLPAGARIAPHGRPLEGYTIALDPGHLGGRWAKMEERWFRIGDSKPVMEGELTLTTARLLARRLEALGASVAFVRDRTEPVTSLRPDKLRHAAVLELKKHKVEKIHSHFRGPDDPRKFSSIDWESQLLFYRVSEILSRGRIVNERLKPDLVICLHYNAEGWGNPSAPTFSQKNHMHLLVNGSYSAKELAFADQRYDMLVKLLGRTAKEELPLADRVAASLAAATGLPPYTYNGDRAHRVTASPYVWGRNLMANRLYHCPVIYCEPYVMNSQPVFERVQLGDYDGTKRIDGVRRKSIYREYADAVAAGVARYFREEQAK